ncbi:MAG: GNAT family N-acetyltransferase [Candidatus Thorarchaeota archaeon]|nr:MAG: GNAT family N-acetyltransferase [Candidatus Thorarchaeota archaeon]
MSDLDDIMKHYNNWELRRQTGVPVPKSRRLMETWIEKASLANPWKNGMVYFVIVDKKNDEFLGVARFFGVKSAHNRARLSVSIYDSQHRSKGYGKDAVRVMLWIGFHVLGFHSINLDTMEDNLIAIHIFEEAGFKRVGILRETELVDGKHIGLLYMDILRDEFMEKYPSGTVIGESSTD